MKPTFRIVPHRFSVTVSSKVTLSCVKWTLQTKQSSKTNNNDDADDDDDKMENKNNNTNKSNKTCVVFCHQFGKMGGSGNLLVSMAQRLIYESVGISTTKKQTATATATAVSSSPPPSSIVDNAYHAVTFDMRGVGRST